MTERSGPVIEVFADDAALAAAAADVFSSAISEAIAARGRCSLALSRVSSPPGWLAKLASAELAWSAVDALQVDERVAPDGSEERNLTEIARDVGGVARLHPMRVSEDLAGDAGAYAAELADVCGLPPVIDVVHLGLGPDGHTASLVPDDPVLDADAPVAVTKPYDGSRRVTLTYRVLDRAGLVIFVVSGAAKAPALRRVLAGDEAMPAARVRAKQIRFLVDRAAGAELDQL